MWVNITGVIYFLQFNNKTSGKRDGSELSGYRCKVHSTFPGSPLHSPVPASPPQPHDEGLGLAGEGSCWLCRSSMFQEWDVCVL